MLNQCTFFGRLATDPVIHVTSTDKPVCRFRFAVPVMSKDGEKTADFFTMEAWNKTATLISEHLKKGDRVLLSSRAKQKTFVNAKQEIQSVIVFVVTQVFFAGDKKHDVAPVAEDIYLNDDEAQLPFDLEEPEEEPA